jgi:hypothetical protein
MATEARRRCGYRKVGGIYLVAPGTGVPCDRLPKTLTVCPCCNQGIKQARGWTWVDVGLLFGGAHEDCTDRHLCPLCHAPDKIGRAGLLWIGERFYPTPADFIAESETLGISRRIGVIPRGFKLGETWVLFAHSKGATCPDCFGGGLFRGASKEDPYTAAEDSGKCSTCKGSGKLPAIFRAFQPRSIEVIITETQSRDEAYMADLAKRGFTPVIVPDNDRDHQGSVYDDEPEAVEPLFAGEEPAGK